MNYSNIKQYDIANGVGVRVSLFVSGCRKHCPGCFNQDTWDFNAGEPFTDDVIQTIMDSLAPDYISGLSILGGEPLAEENRLDVVRLIHKVKKLYPNKTIWVWTGYTWEELMKIAYRWTFDHYVRSILENIDVLVDGPYEEEKYDILLRFRGSSNQRIIDVKESLKEDKIVLWTDGPILGTRGSGSLLEKSNHDADE